MKMVTSDDFGQLLLTRATTTQSLCFIIIKLFFFSFIFYFLEDPFESLAVRISICSCPWTSTSCASWARANKRSYLTHLPPPPTPTPPTHGPPSHLCVWLFTFVMTNGSRAHLSYDSRTWRSEGVSAGDVATGQKTGLGGGEIGCDA